MEQTASTMGRKFQDDETTSSTEMGGSCSSVNQLSAQAKEVIQKAKSKAGEEVNATMEWVQREGVGAVEAQKERLAGTIDRVVSFIDNAAEKMEQEGDDTVSMYVRSLSDKVHRASQYLHEQDVRQITQNVGSFLRRHSEVVIATTLIAGFVIGRFLKASGRSSATYEPDYGSGETGTIGGFSGEDGFKPQGSSQGSGMGFNSPGLGSSGSSFNETPSMMDEPERSSGGQYGRSGSVAPM